MSQAEVDDIVRSALKSEQDARRRVGILEFDSNTNYINGERGDKGYDDHIYNVDVATTLLQSVGHFMNIPPYATEKNIRDALPNHPSEIEKVEIFGHNLKNTQDTLGRSINDMPVNSVDAREKRVRSVEVKFSRAFAIVTMSSVEEQQKAQHRYMEAFGAKVKSKFYKSLKKDPSNKTLETQLSRMMGVWPETCTTENRETQISERSDATRIVTRLVLNKHGETVYDPIIPKELYARRVMGMSSINTLFLRFSNGSVGVRIADQLSDILQSSGVPAGPIEFESNVGSITNMKVSHQVFKPHYGSKGKNAITKSARDGHSKVSAAWSLPQRQTGEIEMNMAKMVWKTISQMKSEEINHEGDLAGEVGKEEELSGLEKAIFHARTASWFRLVLLRS